MVENIGIIEILIVLVLYLAYRLREADFSFKNGDKRQSDVKDIIELSRNTKTDIAEIMDIISKIQGNTTIKEGLSRKQTENIVDDHIQGLKKSLQGYISKVYAPAKPHKDQPWIDLIKTVASQKQSEKVVTDQAVEALDDSDISVLKQVGKKLNYKEMETVQKAVLSGQLEIEKKVEKKNGKQKDK